MSIFNVLSLLGGLALFLYGMNVMGDGLEKTAGGRLEKILEKLTSNSLKGVLLGAAVTAVIQSSSATTVMVVGFVNSGIMKLSQAAPIIMGANIGTTITSWLLSLTGIESSNTFVKLLKPSSFAPVLAVIGVIFIMFTKSERKRDVGTILLGFAVLMTGMETMSKAVSPLADVPEFTRILLMFSNPVLGMLAGAVLTAIIQSSSASVGILQALCVTGTVPVSVAVPIIMGQNIGTCVTALLSSIGAKKNAKRAAFIHLYFNVIGTLVFMIIFYSLDAFFNFSFLDTTANAAYIAVIHTLFNISATLVLLPFSRGLEKLAVLTIKDGDEQGEQPEELAPLKYLDYRFLETPSYAATKSREVINNMAELSSEALVTAINMTQGYTDAGNSRVKYLENIIDDYEDSLGTYLVQVSGRELSKGDSQMTSMGLQVIGDLERISDIAVNISIILKRMNSRQMQFSQKALGELNIYGNAVVEIMKLTKNTLLQENISLAVRVEPLKEIIEKLGSELKKHHIKRLQKGRCSVESGMALGNLINNYEVAADLCANISAAFIQEKTEVYDTHEYMDRLKQEPNIEFKAMYQLYKDKYSLGAK
jgi:phosphate:Na+ symporter